MTGLVNNPRFNSDTAVSTGPHQWLLARLRICYPYFRQSLLSLQAVAEETQHEEVTGHRTQGKALIWCLGSNPSEAIHQLWDCGHVNTSSIKGGWLLTLSHWAAVGSKKHMKINWALYLGPRKGSVSVGYYDPQQVAMSRPIALDWKLQAQRTSSLLTCSSQVCNLFNLGYACQCANGSF